jgi:hypothetical protein
VRAVPHFANFTLAFALQLRKKHGKTSVRVKKNLRQVKKNLTVQTFKANIATFSLALQGLFRLNFSAFHHNPVPFYGMWYWITVS